MYDPMKCPECLAIYTATSVPTIACVASVPVRKKSSQTIFRKQAARKLGREIEGTLASRPPIFEKRPLFLTRAD